MREPKTHDGIVDILRETLQEHKNHASGPTGTTDLFLRAAFTTALATHSGGHANLA